ncbi:hypothetical protein CsatB_016024 [Cannabis sativa]
MKAMEKSTMLNRNKVHRACIEREIISFLDHPFLPTLYTSFQIWVNMKESTVGTKPIDNIGVGVEVARAGVGCEYCYSGCGWDRLVHSQSEEV